MSTVSIGTWHDAERDFARARAEVFAVRGNLRATARERKEANNNADRAEQVMTALCARAPLGGVGCIVPLHDCDKSRREASRLFEVPQ